MCVCGVCVGGGIMVEFDRDSLEAAILSLNEHLQQFLRVLSVW